MKLMFIVLTVGVLALSFGQWALAATPGCTDCPITDKDQFFSFVTRIVEWLQRLFWVVAAGSGIYTGFLYITASGDPGKLGKAKNQAIYTIVAVVCAVLAFGIPSLVNSFLSIGR